MTIILSGQCETLTGSLGSGFGYCIESRRTKKGTLYHYSRRNARGYVPPDGHWRFILTCANLANMRMHISDIRIGWEELQAALYEAGHYTASENVRRLYRNGTKTAYNADDIRNLKITFGL